MCRPNDHEARRATPEDEICRFAPFDCASFDSASFDSAQDRPDRSPSPTLPQRGRGQSNFGRGLAAILVSFALIAGAEEGVRDYPAQQVAPHTYVIHGPLGYPSVENQGFMNNPAFVVTPQGVVVIDPGSSVQAGRMVLRQIRAVTDRPVTHVFNTHVHGDHWLGNHAIGEVFPQAAILGHPEMIRQAKAGAAEQWLYFMERATQGFTQGTRAVIPDRPVGEGDSLAIDGLHFRIYAPGKAHSGTDIMIALREDSVLFAGDNLLYKRFGQLKDGTFQGGIAALDFAAGLGMKHYVPGHGPSGGVEIVHAYKNYLSILYAETQRLYETGIADYEMKEEIVAKLAAYHDWANFKDEVGRHINQAYTEVEADL
ncbi:MAG: MBL fold metallo-hydrolase [Gammaproteobacteria bacterium]|nr:MBL fold metallo-hydrolase [Gammaproteobacteria bacterium]MBU1961792.1 MBL fold metallo-hydrolase [Gammaproteobacteria bacterium]